MHPECVILQEGKKKDVLDVSKVKILNVSHRAESRLLLTVLKLPSKQIATLCLGHDGSGCV